MRNVFPRSVLIRSIQQIENLEATLGQGWFGAEWTERKRRIQRLLQECEEKGLEVIWLNKIKYYSVDDFYSV